MSITNFFVHVSTEAHIAASFHQREPGRKATKRPVGRPRKHTLTESGQVQTGTDEVTTATLPSTGIEELVGRTSHPVLHVLCSLFRSNGTC